MGLNMGAVFGGLAKSLDDRLKDDMRRTGERSDRVRDYHVTRASSKQDKFDKEQEELQEVLENLSNYMDKSGVEIPEGMTKADFAAQLYTSGGGTLSSGKSLVKSLAVHYEKVGDIKGLVTQANLKTQGKGFGEYINNFVRKPSSMIKVPPNLRGGVGFLKGADITKGIQSEVDATVGATTQADKFGVSGLGLDRTKMVQAQEYSLSKDTAVTSNLQAKANLKAKLIENSMLGSIDTAQINKDFNRVLAAGVKGAGISVTLGVNGQPIFDIKTGTQQFKDVQNVYSDGLTNVTENAIDSRSLKVPGMKATLKSLALSSMAYVVPIDPRKNNIAVSDYEIGKMYQTKKGILLFTGDINTSIKVKD
tara:strand:- start:2088 stop:3179 length:1092 start_codon:yes stop_codon:yes gene_type:complete